MLGRKKSIKLVLKDGSVFSGFSFGAESSAAGEVVFNTGMMGYPETLTDPSYRGQILTLTYPLVGNYGVPGYEKENNLLKHFESDAIHIKGLIISDYSFQYSHWNAKKSLADWLKEFNIPAIYGIDTRALTKKLREHGAMLGKIICNNKDIQWDDPNIRDLVKEVTPKKREEYGNGKKRVLLVDTGAKNNIIRSLIKRNVKVIRVPYDYDFSKEKYHGLLLTNGPGDPTMCRTTIANVQKAMEGEKPVFGICLGNQIMALAAGAKTYKLKYGHRGQNQPCIDLETDRCYITSQNHGFAVDTKTLPKGWKEWFKNANDNTNEGIRHRTKPFMSIQFHPESCPGPVDTAYLFDKFVDML